MIGIDLTKQRVGIATVDDVVRRGFKLAGRPNARTIYAHNNYYVKSYANRLLEDVEDGHARRATLNVSPLPIDLKPFAIACASACKHARGTGFTGGAWKKV